jgi:predicted nucleic acid-binding Zn ribbon protein
LTPGRADDREPRRLGESLDRVTHTLGAANSDALAGLFGRWTEIVGPQLATHARPLSLTRGVLVVGVDEPGWATQLRYLEADLLGRLGKALGEGVVERVEVRLRPA